jgi:hypothetical protein
MLATSWTIFFVSAASSGPLVGLFRAFERKRVAIGRLVCRIDVTDWRHFFLALGADAAVRYITIEDVMDVEIVQDGRDVQRTLNTSIDIRDGEILSTTTLNSIRRSP